MVGPGSLLAVQAQLVQPVYVRCDPHVQPAAGGLGGLGLAFLGRGGFVGQVAGAFDQAAAALGAGATVGSKAVLSCGTAWVVYAVANAPVLDEFEQIPLCCHTDPLEWGLVLPFSGSSTYDWLRSTLKKRSSTARGQTEPLVFIPHLYGGLSPDWRGESKGSLLGLSMAHTYEDIEVALMRGLGFEARRNLEAAERLCGPIPSVRMVGGAAKSRTWPQMIADILARPLELSPILESACFGAAKLAAGPAAQGWEDRHKARLLLPNPEAAKAMDREYVRYLRFYAALLPPYEEDARKPKRGI